MSYTVSLYRNNSGNKYMNKSLTHLGDVTCEFKNIIDVRNPEIVIAATDQYDIVNYVYIPHFNRFYYAKPAGNRGQVITYSCKSDPLMSFKNQILSCPAVIRRNPWKYDMYIPDPDLPVESRTVKSILKFPNDHFNGNFNAYIITTLGPGGDIEGIELGEPVEPFDPENGGT